MWAKYRLMNRSDIPKLISILEGAATSYKIEKDIIESGIFFKVSKQEREHIEDVLEERGIITESIY